MHKGPSVATAAYVSRLLERRQAADGSPRHSYLLAPTTPVADPARLAECSAAAAVIAAAAGGQG